MNYAMAAPYLALIGALAFVGAHAEDSASSADQAFVAMVSQGGMFEVLVGQLAADQASTPDLKDQGATEAHDHQLVNQQLKLIAEAAGIPYSAFLNDTFQKQYDHLKGLSGFDFQKAYLAEMEDLHAKDGAAFAKEAKSGQNLQLKAFAALTHRTVVRHIGELQALGPMMD